MATTGKPRPSGKESRPSASAPRVAKEGPFSAEERAAMRERASEVRASTRRPRGAKVHGEAEVLAKIEQMPEPDRQMARRVHAIVRRAAPRLEPRLWYGMPAYARGGEVVCFFQDAHKFKARYATLGFADAARLDDGAMWPTAYALAGLTGHVEAEIARLVERAAG